MNYIMKILNYKFNIQILILLSIPSLTTHAQTRIMVEHENNTSIYDNIAAALANAPVEPRNYSAVQNR